jgi:hypothetical protein
MGKLTTLKVKNAKPGRREDGSPKAVRLSDGLGLHMLVKPSGGKSWVLRVQVDGKIRDVGLGTVDVDGLGNSAFGKHDPLGEMSLMQRTILTLAEAREKATALRKLAKAGADPVLERDKERRKVPTFAEALVSAHKALGPSWATKTAKAFKATLEEHAAPKLGSLKVDAIGASDIISALAPIWTDKPEMAKKVRVRIMQVLAFAKAHGWRTDALPDFREMRSGGLSAQARGGNFAAMPFLEVPGFVAGELAKDAAAGRFAVIFAILTGRGRARSGTRLGRKSIWRLEHGRDRHP